MFLRYALSRVLSAVAAVLFMAAALSSCLGIEMQVAPSVQPPPALGSESAAATTSDPAAVRFAELLGQILKGVPESSGALNDTPLNLFFRPALKENTGSDYTYVKMRLTEPGKPAASDITISGETNWNAETGDASFIAYQQTGTGETQEAGIWVTDNTMIFKKGHDVRPSLQHTLMPQVAESMRTLPALSRLLCILDDTNAVKMSPEDWGSAVGALQKVVADNCRAQDIAAQNGSDSFGGSAVATITETMKLIGPRGLTVSRGLLALLAKDNGLKALFNTEYFTDGTTYGVAGIDGALRDIDALGDSDRSAAVTTIRLVETDKPVGFHMTVSAGSKTLSLNVSFYRRGFVTQNDLVFGGFDGSRVVISQVFTSDGTGSFSSSFSYDTMSPGAQPQENITVLSSGTFSGSSFSETAQLSFTRAASPVSDAVIIGGTLSYSQKPDGAGTTGNGTGTLNIRNGGTAHAYNYDLTLIQTGKGVPVTPPDFDRSEGRSTADQEKLYRALGAFDGKSFVLAPPTTRYQAIFTLLFN